MNRTTRHLVLAATLAGLLALTACGDDTAGTDQPSQAPSETTTSSEPSTPETSDSTSEPSESTASPSETTSAPASGAVPVYYLGDTAKAGPRLFREWRPGKDDRLVTALSWATQGRPKDPDYYTLWAEGAPLVLGASVQDDVIEIDLSPDAGLDQRPAGMTKREAVVSIQQLVFTAQGAVQQTLPVRFLLGGEPATTIYGVDTSDPVRRASPLATLNLINITTPQQGATVSGKKLTVTGVGSSFEASGMCELVTADEVIVQVPWMADGWIEDRLYPWTTTIPLAKAGTGDAVVRCLTDDPTGGTEGFGTFVDDKLIRIR